MNFLNVFTCKRKKKQNRQTKLTTNPEKYMADAPHILKSTCKNNINKEYLHIYKQKSKKFQPLMTKPFYFPLFLHPSRIGNEFFDT